MKEYALFVCCLIPARLPGLEAISIKVLERFGVQTRPMRGASCCPDPVVMRSLDYKAWLVIAARNLSIAEEMRSDVLTLCSGCFSTLGKANKVLKEDQHLRNEVDKCLSEIGRGFLGTINVRHVAEVIRDLGPEIIGRQLQKPLKAWKAAAQHGCHLVRPSDVLHVDDPNRPTILDQIVSWVGATPVDYMQKMLCCGVGIRALDPDTNLIILRERLASIREAGANCIVTPCPFCFIQFDMGQREVNRKFNESYAFPVFYISKLLGLAVGFTPEEVGLQFHTTQIKEV